MGPQNSKEQNRIMFTVSGTAPTTVGIGLDDGELDFEPRSTDTGQAVTVLRRYESGNPLHLVATGTFLDGEVTLSPDVPEGPHLTHESIAAQKPAASVVVGAEAVDLSELLSKPHEVPYSTQTMCEAIYRREFVSGVEARFQVRLFEDNVLWIRVIVSRGDPKRGGSTDGMGLLDNLKVIIAGKTMFAGGDLPIYRNGGARGNPTLERISIRTQSRMTPTGYRKHA